MSKSFKDINKQLCNFKYYKVMFYNFTQSVNKLSV